MYTTLDVVFNRLHINTGSSIQESDAVEFVIEALSMIAPGEILTVKITDGNPDEGHPNPLEVINYRAEMPCDVVEPLNIFDIETYSQLRESMSPTHMLNFAKAKAPFDKWNKYTPDSWTKGSVDKNSDLAFQIKKGHIYTNFETGGLILVYLGWPMDEDGNILIPSDQKIIRAITSFLQYKIDYRLWRNGDIADKVYQDSELKYLFDIGAAHAEAKLPSDGLMESISNFMRSWVPNQNAFKTHMVSTGRSDKLRIQ